MNTNSNIYTVIYTTLVCVLVAAILAFVSQWLKPKQDANEKAETISQILTAAGFDQKAHWQEVGNAATLDFYKENLAEASLVNAQGETVGTLDKDKAVIYTPSELKVQNRSIKGGKEFKVPVYTFSNGVTVIPVYGAGLWGPVWGYLSFDENLDKLVGAYFDHESETPGLGGKIKDDPAFRAQFQGKSVDFADAKPFDIVKGGAPAGKENAIDAITGATMTSKGLNEAIVNWLEAYKGYLQGKVQAKAAEEAALAAEAEAEAAEENAETTAE
ncbi:MAG: NADH:ubiquinone reductase (Na(+)-transporting) subunit C [Bacteroidales bacterium]|nr:NADH:ubiquinone reductase (Na(+)-transporting) subunit C [Bacteroidales bacterium]